MRVDRIYMVSGTRKERRAQIAAMGRKQREMRMRAFLATAHKAQADKETL